MQKYSELEYCNVSYQEDKKSLGQKTKTQFHDNVKLYVYI